MSRMGTNARLIGPLSRAVSAELRAELARQSYSVRGFSKMHGVPLTRLHKTLRGERVVDVEDLYSLSELLGIEPVDVLRRAQRIAESE